jgi:signal transduction histidine kinase
MRLPSTLFRVLVAVLSAVALLLAGVGSAAAQGSTRVLLVFDEDRSLPGLAVLDQALRTTFRAGLGDLEIFSESLSLSQFQDADYEGALRTYYSNKYRLKKPDLIVAVMGPSLRFLLRHGQELFPGTPIVFCGADADDIRGTALPANVTGILVRRTFAPTVDVALQLQPTTSHVYVVGGTSAFDRHLQQLARSEFERFGQRLSFHYLTELSTSDLLSTVSRLPPRSVIFYLTWFRDIDGQTYVPHDMAERISEAANAPVFAFVDQYLGRGPVGGYVYSVESHGKGAADIGLRVLKGESPSSIPVAEFAANAYVFDAVQLSRWGLDERRLPPGSLIHFREPGLWERYGWYVVGAGAALLAQSGLIAGLLLQRRRRHQAESALRASFDRLRDLGARLVSAEETERSRIARELHDDISQQLVVLRIELQLLLRTLDDSTRERVAGLSSQVEGLAMSVHELSHRLHPTRLRVHGLVGALDGLRRELSQSGLDITFTHENVPEDLSPDHAVCLFRVAQEALQNVIKYGSARHASVRLVAADGKLELSIVDDGVGFDVDKAARRGLGLTSMGERIEVAGGTFRIQSQLGSGTRLNVTVPVGVTSGSDVPLLMSSP